VPEAARRRRQGQSKAGAARGFAVCGEHLVPDVTGALFWPDASVLVISDLHFEKGSSFARRGVHLPPYDTASTLSLIEQVTAALCPRMVIALGDSFHDDGGPHRLDAGDSDRIRTLTAATDWIWIAGNHDPAPPAGLGGRSAHELCIGPFIFRHEPAPAPQVGEVAGHLHPAGVVAARGRRLRRRCFVTDGTRVVMPAFGAYTGGLDLAEPAFAALFPDPFHAWMIGERGVYPVTSKRLAGI